MQKKKFYLWKLLAKKKIKLKNFHEFLYFTFFFFNISNRFLKIFEN